MKEKFTKNKKLIIGSVTLFLFSFLLYVNTLSHQYALDDSIVITDNTFTKQGVAGIKSLLKHDTFLGFFNEEGKSRLVSGGRYRPLTPILFAIEYQVWGQNPLAGHLFNLFWYAGSIVLLFLTFSMILKERFPDRNILIGFVLALLFSAHPIHTEVVANIKGRDEIVALFFSIAALYFYFQHIDKKKNLPLLFVALSLFLGLTAKENTITFVAIIPMTVWFFRDKVKVVNFLSLASLLVPVIVFLLLRAQAIGKGSDASIPMELMNNPFVTWNGSQYVLMSFAEKSATITYTLGYYVKLLLFPHPLTHDYYPRHIEVMNWVDLKVILSLLIYIAGVVLAVIGWKKKSVYAYSILFFIIALSPVSNIFFPIGTNMSERFVYMPSVAFALTTAFLLTRLLERRVLFIALTGLIVLLYSAKTYTRNPVWHDNASLFLTDVKTSVNSAKLQNATGGEKIRLANLNEDKAIREKMLLEAIEHLNKAIVIHPTYKNAYLLLGNAYLYLNQYDNAIAHYLKTLEIDPGYKDGIGNLAIAYRTAGQHYGEKEGNLSKSIEFLEKSLNLEPENPNTLRLLGVASGVAGNNSDAVMYFRKASELQPDNAEIWFNLGIALSLIGDEQQSQQAFNRAATLDPEILNRNRK